MPKARMFLPCLDGPWPVPSFLGPCNLYGDRIWHLVREGLDPGQRVLGSGFQTTDLEQRFLGSRLW